MQMLLWSTLILWVFVNAPSYLVELALAKTYEWTIVYSDLLR